MLTCNNSVAKIIPQGMGVISGPIWQSFEGSGSFQGLYRFIKGEHLIDGGRLLRFPLKLFKQTGESVAMERELN